MANHLAKASGSGSIPQGDRVVSDPEDSPVCLDTVPGAHKHLSKTEMLLGVLVKGFDPDPLQIDGHHLRFGHLQVVGDKEPGPVLGLGDKKERGPDLGQMDEELGDPKPSLFGSSNGFVFPRSLGQVTEGGFPSIHFDDAVSFDGGKKRPPCLHNQVENRSTGIPGIHQDSKRGSDLLDGFGEDFDRDLDFALESPLGRSAFGPVTLNRPHEALSPCLDNAGDGTKSFDEAVGRVVNTQAFDLLSFPGRGGVVEDKKRMALLRPAADLTLIFLLEALDLLGRSLQELVKAIGIALSKFVGNLPDRAKLHQPNETDKVNQKIDPLRFVHAPQESRKVRRNFLGCFFAHGFRALLAFAGIGDFGRKPFYLKNLLSWVT